MRATWLGVLLAVSIGGFASGCTRRSGDDDNGPADGGAGRSGGGLDAGNAGRAGRQGSPAGQVGGGGRMNTGGFSGFDGPRPISGAPGIAGSGAPGNFEEKCCRDNQLMTCSCPYPDGWCNYASGLRVCSDGTCRQGASSGLCVEDIGCVGGEEDYSRTVDIRFEPLPGWTRCCVAGVTRLCWQPEDAECNYEAGLDAEGNCPSDSDAGI